VIRRYAERTSVPVDRSRAEVERLLVKNGATQFVFGAADGQALLAFEIPTTDAGGDRVKRRLRFLVPMPTMGRGTTEQRVKAETRRRWRALLLVLKAKLEAVSSSIVTFDQEFLAHIVVEGSTTVGDRFVPTLSMAIEQGGNLPPLLLGAG
jgi:hypothetical protein